MTPEYIEACKKAKEEGWLLWEPKWGDKCWYVDRLWLVSEVVEEEEMTDWIMAHPWMTFFLMVFFLMVISEVAVRIWGK